ncbi:NACHT domain-containing protein [Streptomyces sp. NPDC051243]|uniref:NACHT domain-containing protein n=1 Tax=Streptomyces sp. NPDC051243 TaxID=3365646 RepID=UPI00379AA938
MERVPTRRLMILGGPGTGKTMLLIHLLLALTAVRTQGGPVPVLFSLASWNPQLQSLEAWMAERPTRDYSGLGDPRTGHAVAAALLEQRLVLQIRDGFDELPKPFRARALDAINSALPPARSLILTSRPKEYGDTRAPAHEHRGVLRRTGAVRQFRHIDPPDHLAAPEPSQESRAWRPGPPRPWVPRRRHGDREPMTRA